MIRPGMKTTHEAPRKNRLGTDGETTEEKGILNILVVEDERKVAKAIKEGLEGNSYSVAVAHTGEEGFFRANSEEFDLVIFWISCFRNEARWRCSPPYASRGIGFPCCY